MESKNIENLGSFDQLGLEGRDCTILFWLKLAEAT
jgi:hypothetical protein